MHFQLESREHLAAGVIPGAQQTSTVVAAPSAAFAIPSGAGGSEAQGLAGSVRSGNDGAAPDTVMAMPALAATPAGATEERTALVEAALVVARDRASAAEAALAASRTVSAKQAQRIAKLERQLRLRSSVQQTAHPGAALAPTPS